MPQKFNLNSRTIAAPLAAFCMASILFVYARTSIQAAKRNAQQHREADGGQINWHNESLRRHGKLDAPVKQGTVVQLLSAVKDKGDVGKETTVGADSKGKGAGETEAERKVRERRNL